MELARKIVPVIIAAVVFGILGYFIGVGAIAKNQGASVFAIASPSSTFSGSASGARASSASIGLSSSGAGDSSARVSAPSPTTTSESSTAAPSAPVAPTIPPTVIHGFISDMPSFVRSSLRIVGFPLVVDLAGVSGITGGNALELVAGPASGTVSISTNAPAGFTFFDKVRNRLANVAVSYLYSNTVNTGHLRFLGRDSSGAGASADGTTGTPAAVTTAGSVLVSSNTFGDVKWGTLEARPVTTLKTKEYPTPETTGDRGRASWVRSDRIACPAEFNIAQSIGGDCSGTVIPEEGAIKSSYISKTGNYSGIAGEGFFSCGKGYIKKIVLVCAAPNYVKVQ